MFIPVLIRHKAVGGRFSGCLNLLLVEAFRNSEMIPCCLSRGEGEGTSHAESKFQQPVEAGP